MFSGAAISRKTGEYGLIHDASGVVIKAFVGSGSGEQELALAQAALLIPPGIYQVNEPVTQNAAVFWALAQYRFHAYKQYNVQARRLVVAAESLKDISALAQAQFVVRDLINTPPNHMGPEQMALFVQQLAANHGAHFEQLVGDELLQAGFPGVYSVGCASAAAPRLISLTWGNEQDPKITLVGKGVCFDSGGLNIKPSSGMRLMKKDMGGAAHVIGLAQWIMQSQLAIRLRVLIPAVENSIGPNAFRPGDVITMRNGLTVEVDNTDAEGRLILADALVKASEEQPDLIIDFATLTGAARAAVGTDIAAMFTNNDLLAAEITKASNKASDPVWRLPLYAGYEDMLNSSIADLANCSASAYAGAITAGLFLQRFIDPAIPWVHFDIMAWNVSSKPGKPEGGEALGFRAIAEYLSQYA